MAKKHEILPDHTIIDVVAIKGNRVVITPMTFGESKTMKKIKGWKYCSYQRGFHFFKNQTG